MGLNERSAEVVQRGTDLCAGAGVIPEDFFC